MAMRKIMQSKNEVVIISEKDDVSLFRPGERYMIDDIEFTVVKAYNADNTEMREVSSSHGGKEIVTVQTLRKDAEEHGFKMLKSINLPDPNKPS